jgi:hypothetical protein
LQYTDVGTPVLLAVDNYNALYGGSEFLVYPHAKHRRHLGAHELKLCRWMREMRQPMVNGVRVHATSTRAGVRASPPCVRLRERVELVGSHTGGGNALTFKQPS